MTSRLADGRVCGDVFEVLSALAHAGVRAPFYVGMAVSVCLVCGPYSI